MLFTAEQQSSLTSEFTLKWRQIRPNKRIPITSFLPKWNIYCDYLLVEVKINQFLLELWIKNQQLSPLNCQNTNFVQLVSQKGNKIRPLPKILCWQWVHKLTWTVTMFLWWKQTTCSLNLSTLTSGKTKMELGTFRKLETFRSKLRRFQGFGKLRASATLILRLKFSTKLNLNFICAAQRAKNEF